MARGAGTHPMKARQMGVVAMPFKFSTDGSGVPTAATATGHGWVASRTGEGALRLTLAEQYVSVDSWSCSIYGAQSHLQVACSADSVNASTPYVDFEVNDAASMITITNPAAAGVDVHAAIVESAADAYTTAITDPAIPRSLQVISDAGWQGGNITVVGTDQFDNAVTELFTIAAPGTPVLGTKIFKTVTSITKSATAGAADTATVQTGPKLGLPLALDAATSAAVLVAAGATDDVCKGVIELPLASFADADGDIVKFANAGADGLTLVDSKSFALRFNNAASPPHMIGGFGIPIDADVTQDMTMKFLVSKTGNHAGDATTITVELFNQVDGALHDADADYGGVTGAVVPAAAAKTLDVLTLTLAHANLPAAGSRVSMSMHPTDGTLGTDDFCIHRIWVEYVKKARLVLEATTFDATYHGFTPTTAANGANDYYVVGNFKAPADVLSANISGVLYLNSTAVRSAP